MAGYGKRPFVPASACRRPDAAGQDDVREQGGEQVVLDEAECGVHAQERLEQHEHERPDNGAASEGRLGGAGGAHRAEEHAGADRKREERENGYEHGIPLR